MFYVGGKFQDKSSIRSVIKQITDQTDWTCSFSWPDNEQHELVTCDELSVISEKELEAVHNSNVCFFILNDFKYSYRGTLCEMAVATMSETCKHVFAIMDQPCKPSGTFSLDDLPEYFKTHIFLYHKKVKWVRSIEDALNEINKEM